MNESIETKIELIEADIVTAYTEAEAKGALQHFMIRSIKVSRKRLSKM